MPSNEDPIIIPIEADFEGFETAMKALEKSSEKFSRSFTSAMKSVIRDGASFEDTLKSLALRMSDIVLQSSLKPLENVVGNVLQSVATSVGSSLTGGSGSSLSLARFVDPISASVSSNPTTARTSNSVVADRTIARAVPQASPSNVTINIATPDVESFKKSQTQISNMLARSVSRSRRGS